MNSLWMDATLFVIYSFKVLGTILETVVTQWICHVTFQQQQTKK